MIIYFRAADNVHSFWNFWSSLPSLWSFSQVELFFLVAIKIDTKALAKDGAFHFGYTYYDINTYTMNREKGEGLRHKNPTNR